MNLPSTVLRASRHGKTGRQVAAACAIAAVGGFDLLFRLGAPDWSTDELAYRDSGWSSFHGGSFLANPEHPPLAKHIVGVFEILFGRSETPVRMSAVVAGVLTGVFLALIARRVAGNWAALATAAVWFALPHPADLKLERFALLDVFMAMFTTLAILCVVHWSVSRTWRWVVATGIAVGLATACKLPGALAYAPVGVFVVVRGRFSVRSWLQLSALTAAGVGAFVAAYIPAVRQMPHQVGYMIAFQGRQRTQGHPVLVGGHVYRHPPWWTQLRWQWDASWVLALCYLAVVVFAVVIARRDPDMALLVGVLVTTFGFFAFVSGNILGQYPYAWAPVLAVITGLTLREMAGRGGLVRVGALVIALALVVPAAQLIVRTASIRRTDYAAAAELLRARVGPAPSVVVVGYGDVLLAYLPRCRLVRDTARVVATAVVFDPEVADRRAIGRDSKFLAAHPLEFSGHRIGRLTVYLPSAPGPATHP